MPAEAMEGRGPQGHQHQVSGTDRAEMGRVDRGPLALVTVRDAKGGTRRAGTVEEGDVLFVRGPGDRMAAFATDMGLAVRSDEDGSEGSMADTLFKRDSGLADVLIPPRSPLIGEHFFPGMVTVRGDVIVLAI
jgi:hypothetical protein